jgi:diguanylate cyclase (GGDEF)-like protein
VLWPAGFAGGLVGRFGGEEFVALLLPAADAQGTAVVAERLRDQVAGLVVPLATGHAVRVTVSIGVVVSHSSTLSVPDLLAAADHYMYRAKAGAGTRS